jgi:SAM-dependent methyltransferase
LSDKIVLDLASGEGYGSDLLACYSKQVIGVDINDDIIEHAKSKYIKNNLTFLTGSADNIPLLDNTIDVFVSFETIEHHKKHKEMMSEIKRVLKKDGILIISSPDKLNYTDMPNYCNPFHVKELYYEEFRTLIKEAFIFNYFFSQRVFTGSIIAFDNNSKSYKKPIVINKNGSSSPFTPIYNLAIATDNNSFEINHLLVLYKENEPYFSYDDIQIELYKAQKMVYNSLSYRVGFFFISPLKKFLRIFKRRSHQ